MSGGEGGIRTPDTFARTPDFESGTFNHSATSPNYVAVQLIADQNGFGLVELSRRL